MPDDPIQETIATYDAAAAAFADRTCGLDLEAQLARLAARLGLGARVLDVGCGPGRDVAWFARHGFDAWGTDLSFRMLREARARGVTLPLVQADMAHLPFRKGSFRGLWVCASLLHVPKAQAGDVLRELARVVQPGHIYLAVKRGEGAEWVSDAEGNRRYFVYYHPAEIQLLVERSGFEVISCWENEGLASPSPPWINVLAWTRIRTPKTGTCAVVRNARGEVLLTRRADNGRWCLPGGHLDYGETVSQCAVREVYEETGLRVEVERLVGVYSRPIPAGEGVPNPTHIVMLSFLCRPVGGELALNDEVTEVRFFPPDALPPDLWSWHRLRIEDALAESQVPFVR